MPKIIEYPHASFKNALNLAQSVDELGGSCNIKTCAEKMDKKLSGGFTNLIAASVKFGFVKMSKGTLFLEQTYKDYKLAYDEKERIQVLQKAFFAVPLFKKVYDKYKDVKLPADLLDKVLIRELGVDQKAASRVSGYFIDAAKQVRILNPDNSFNKAGTNIETRDDPDAQIGEESENNNETPQLPLKPKGNNYVIHITGPSINQTIEIEEEDHLLLVEAAIKIIKKKLSVKKDEATKSTD